MKKPLRRGAKAIPDGVTLDRADVDVLAVLIELDLLDFRHAPLDGRCHGVLLPGRHQAAPTGGAARRPLRPASLRRCNSGTVNSQVLTIIALTGEDVGSRVKW
jgi:hypothetical protein